MYDVIVVGSGFSGAIIARYLAEKNKKILILEKRAHIGGNMYEKMYSNGVLVHCYGPHIFHTNSEKVFNYLKRFSNWFKYEHKVLGSINNTFVPIPFNYNSLEKLFHKQQAKIIKNKLSNYFPSKKRISILDLLNNSDSTIKNYGKFIFDNVFTNYTSKQWGIPIDKIDTSIINRVPVILGYDDRYFQDKIQYMPTNGFNYLFKNILNHHNIQIMLNCNATKKIKLDIENKKIYFDDKPWNKPIIYTGSLDELLDYKFGQLAYRSLDLIFEQYNMTTYQPAAVINYPNEEKFTRITEFKYLTNQNIDKKTTILKEYPIEYKINISKEANPYYPILNHDNLNLYDKYKESIDKFHNIYLCGRLAEYKYYNMDAVIEKALSLSNLIKV